MFAQYILPLNLLLPLAAAVAALGAVTFFLLKGNGRERAALLAVGLVFALLYDCFYVTALREKVEARVGTEHTASLRVTDYMEECGGDGWGGSGKYRLRVRWEDASCDAYLYGDRSVLADAEPGNRLVGTFTVTDASRIHGESIDTFISKGVELLLFANGAPNVTKGDAGSWRYFPTRLCRRMKESVGRLYEDDTGALVLAVLTGDSSALSEERYADLSGAGVLHITAVSGLHCMFLLSMVRMLVGKRRRLRATVALAALTLYACVVGGAPSVVRAVVMTAFMLTAPLFRRESDTPTSLAAALFLLLLCNPCAARSVGLQLSFAAVLGLTVVTPRLYERMTRTWKRAGWRFIASSLAATAGALAFTLPLTAVYFKSLAVVTPVSNLLCLPAAGLLFASAFLSVVFGMFCPPLAVLPALVAKGAAVCIFAVCRFLSSLPFHSIVCEGFYIKAWLLFAYLLFFFVLFLRENRREVCLSLACVTVTLVLACFLTARDFRSGTLNIYQLDVGQGAATLAVTEEATALFDCGSGNTYINAAAPALRFLSACGAKRLDYLVLTHYHIDHTDGLPALFAACKVGSVLLPPPTDEDKPLAKRILALAEGCGTEVRFLTEDEEIALSKRVRVRLFPPVALPQEADQNENCLSAWVNAGNFDFLLTGDMNGEGEKALAERTVLPDAEVILAGHHGSRSSATSHFLETVTPEVGLISVGDNTYGHPTPETVRRLQNEGADVYRTDENGTVRIRVR